MVKTSEIQEEQHLRDHDIRYNIGHQFVKDAIEVTLRKNSEKRSQNSPADDSQI